MLTLINIVIIVKIFDRNKSGIIQVDTSKSGMRFRNKELEELNKEWRILSSTYEEQQAELIKHVVLIA